MKPGEFWELTLTEFERMGRGYLRRNADAKRPTRLVATLLANIHRKPGTPAQTPEEFMPLYGDAPYAPAMDEEEFDATMARLAEFDTLKTAA